MEPAQTIKLNDLCIKVKNGASSFYLKEGTVPLKIIRHAHVSEDGSIKLAAVEEMLMRDSSRTAGNLLKENDILIAIRGPMKVAIVPKEAEGYSFAAEFAALEIDADKIRPEIVAAYLRQPHVNTYLEQRAPTRAIRSVSLPDILDLAIRVPSPEKQAKMAELLSLISEQQQIIREEQAKLSALQQTVLQQMTGGCRK